MQRLVKIALYTTFAGMTGVIILQQRKISDISQSEYFREAFKILRANKGLNPSEEHCEILLKENTFSGAIQYLGEPIKQLGFKIEDEDNWNDESRAKYHVRVKGPKDKGEGEQDLSHQVLIWADYPPGMIYFWAQTDDDGKWKINRLELELNSQPEHRLLIKDGPEDPL